MKMDDLERDKMLACAYQLRDWELEPFSWNDPFSDMGTDEKSKLLLEFMNQNHSLKEIVELMKSERASSLDYKAKFEEEHKLNISLQSRLDNLLQTIDSLREQVDLMNQHRYGSKPRRESRPDHSRLVQTIERTRMILMALPALSVWIPLLHLLRKSRTSKPRCKPKKNSAITAKEWSIAQ